MAAPPSSILYPPSSFLSSHLPFRLLAIRVSAFLIAELNPALHEMCSLAALNDKFI